MAKRHVYTKSEHGIGDFVYVDLLPEVRRPRQFNVNVILSLFFAVLVFYVLIFVPVNNKTIQLEELNSWNNDLKHELTLIQEEFVGYEIDLEVIKLENEIDNVRDLRVDFNNLLDDVELEVNDVSGNISFISYSAEQSQLRVTVQLTSFYSYNSLEQEFLNLDWVVSSENTTPEKNGDEVQYSATFILEVDPNVE
jgi:septal ring factor EnvC (AmiA/AmiB activator)